MPLQDLTNLLSPEKPYSLEEVLFPANMKNRELLRRSPHANFFLEISPKISGRRKQEIHEIFIPYISHLNLDFANWLNNWGKARLSTGERNSGIEDVLYAFSEVWSFPLGKHSSLDSPKF